MAGSKADTDWHFGWGINFSRPTQSVYVDNIFYLVLSFLGRAIRATVANIQRSSSEFMKRKLSAAMRHRRSIAETRLIGRFSKPIRPSNKIRRAEMCHSPAVLSIARFYIDPSRRWRRHPPTRCYFLSPVGTTSWKFPFEIKAQQLRARRSKSNSNRISSPSFGWPKELARN